MKPGVEKVQGGEIHDKNKTRYKEVIEQNSYDITGTLKSFSGESDILLIYIIITYYLMTARIPSTSTVCT